MSMEGEGQNANYDASSTLMSVSHSCGTPCCWWHL